MDDCAVDGSHIRAFKGGDHVGPSPVDRGRPGSKHHVIVDRQGIPLAVSLTGGNRHDVTQLIPLLDAIPHIGGLRGRPRNRPKRMFADRGYDFDKYRRLLWKRGIKPLIARRCVAHGSGLGKTRWVAERTFAWLHIRTPTNPLRTPCRPPRSPEAGLLHHLSPPTAGTVPEGSVGSSVCVMYEWF